MDDLISRQAAIDAVGRYLKKDGDVITIADVVDAAVAIGMLPSAEPNEQIKWERDTAIQQLADLGYGLGEKPRGDDCISRAAAIDELDKGLWGVEWDKALAEAMIKSVPSAEPERKKGKWIDGQCSICGCDIPAYIIDWEWQKDMDANFCPNCGARMEK